MIYSVYFIELNIHFLLFLSLFILINKTVTVKQILSISALAFVINEFGLIDDVLFHWLHENNYISRNINPQILKIYPFVLITILQLCLLFKKTATLDFKFITMINTMVLLSIFAFHNTFIYTGLTKFENKESMNKVYVAMSIEDKSLMDKYCDQDENLYCIRVDLNKKISLNLFNDVEKRNENRRVIFDSFKELDTGKNAPYYYAWMYTISFKKTFIFGYKSDHKTYKTLVIDNKSSGQNFIATQTIFSTLSTISSTFWIFVGLFMLFYHKKRFCKK